MNKTQLDTITRGLKRRYLKECAFRWLGRTAVMCVGLFLFFLLFQIASKGYPAFFATHLTLPVSLTPSAVDSPLKPVRAALLSQLPGHKTFSASEKRKVYALLSRKAVWDVRDFLKENPGFEGTHTFSFLLSSDADLYIKNQLPRQDVFEGKGEATPSGTTGSITMTFSDSAMGSVLKKMSDPSLEQTIFVHLNGGIVKLTAMEGMQAQGDVLIPPSSTSPAPSKTWSIKTVDLLEQDRKLTDRELAFLDYFFEKNTISTHINTQFFLSNDSRSPELAGIFGALVGSFFIMVLTAFVCVPTGIAAALYLEEFAPKNRWTEWLEINIQNLAAVPSIIFGLLGLAIFLNFFYIPRSSALVGGLVLALLVLPTLIVSARSALKTVPVSIKQAGLAIGASHQQVVFHHVLPLALPGMMTGTIISMARALGETAPLLMVGMVAFIIDLPTTLLDASSALPIQIFLWSDLPEPAFQYKTSAAILVLLMFLFLMNAGAIVLRKRFERRW